jgi:ATP-dependent Lon protease
LYRSILGEHGWGERFAPEPHADVIDQLAEMAPREMRRALMTAFGNARLDRRDEVEPQDLPKPGSTKGRIGFMQ